LLRHNVLAYIPLRTAVTDCKFSILSYFLEEVVSDFLDTTPAAVLESSETIVNGYTRYPRRPANPGTEDVDMNDSKTVKQKAVRDKNGITLGRKHKAIDKPEDNPRCKSRRKSKS
jgi:hypothetical protein